MRTKYLNIAAIVCACAYLIAAGSVAARIASRINSNEILSGKEFEDMVDRASAAAILGFMDEPFREAVRDGIENSRTLSAAIVTGPEGAEYAVEKSSGHLAPGDGEPRFILGFGAREMPLFSPLRFEGVRNATISAQAILISKADIFLFLRDALFAVMAGLLAALVFLVLPVTEAVASSREGAAADAPEEPATGRGEDPRTKGMGRRPERAEWKAEIPAVPLADEGFDIPDLSADVAEDLPPIATGTTADVAAVESAETATTAGRSFAGTQDDGPPAEEARQRIPTGLYSPRSGLGWEEYAGDRIASELHRCASFEQDLVFIAMEARDGTAEKEWSIATLADEIIAFFGFKDLAFERGEYGFSIILPNVGLDRGLRMADEFRDGLQGGTLAALDLRIGLTSRSGRLVDAERLVMEAERALNKALQEDDSPIVAFKPDPERYRAFVAEQN